MTLPWLKWARACTKDVRSPSRITREDLAALTGQDVRALSVIAAAWELYAVGDAAASKSAIDIIRAALSAMQPGARCLARELIPFVLDWSDRDRLWPLVEPGRGGAGGKSFDR